MKKLFGVLLVGVTAVTLAGCNNGGSTDSSSESSQQTSQVSKKASSKKAQSSSTASNSASSTKANSADSNTADTSSTAIASSSSANAVSSTSSVASSQAVGQSQAQTATTVNGLNLTTAQVQDWVAQHVSGNYQADDLGYEMSKDANGELVIQVRENHNSANMQAQGADAGTAPTIGWFKINSQGQLLSSPDAGASWSVVSNSYNN
ncbi:hypothetical protein [Loigolactobacillus coryniformis]|jgi:cytoskeletal protein RodZ|uniref:hypothetical protein n=1 Tax=Loigolactobacillus coryniformis TaxID=1610 RepID=UPI001C5DAACB|nr:hypothetical protein [Loigolactobacillus coryniformis]MBW4802177.1 hypothetical protein [Loigolactobacillus coryniformis subsp. torquens]MBW4804875.1 hypothetical protein [Loigolactobacillus coryniformis subsp. torquens]